jgi:branched-chain amino acid transport system ATP-binding protein
MLTVRQLNAYYGKSHILQGVDLDLERGEIVAMLGRNGVGRSTTLKAIMGLVQRTGSVRFDGKETVGCQPFSIARLGLGFVPEDRAIFSNLTVAQNLLLGLKSGRPSERWTLDDTWQVFPRLKEREDTAAGVLSGGEQQMLAICRTLMGGPQAIMIDEPTEGLSPQMVERVGEVLLRIAQRGISILLVEQKLSIALRISQRVYVMGQGRIVFAGSAAEFASNSNVAKQWLEV